MSYSQLIQQLSDRYCNHEITLEDYRAQRRIVLDKIDQEHNGHHASRASDVDTSKPDDDADRTITFRNVSRDLN